MSTWMIVAGPGASATTALRRGSREADRRGDGGQRGDHEADVLVEVHAQLQGASIDVQAVDRAREAFVLELLLHRAGLEPRDGAPGPHERAGGDEARELIAGVEAAVEQGDSRTAGVVGVRSDRKSVV